MMGQKRVRSAHVAAQRAAEGDVQFLQAPANPEHRLAEVETGGNEVRGHGVAIRVVRPFGIGRIAFAVALGLHVRRAARQQQRSEERRAGKECVSTFKSRWWQYL